MSYADLEKLLNPEIVKNDFLSGNKVKLIETDIPKQVITIDGVDNNNCLVFKPDHFEKKGKCPYLNQSEGILIHKRCDYIIITKYNKKNIVIFCELKSNKIYYGYDQLLYTTSFFEYLASLLKIDKNIDIRKAKKYYIMFSTRSYKRKTNNKLQVRQHKSISVKKARYGKIHISKIIAK